MEAHSLIYCAHTGSAGQYVMSIPETFDAPTEGHPKVLQPAIAVTSDTWLLASIDESVQRQSVNRTAESHSNVLNWFHRCLASIGFRKTQHSETPSRTIGNLVITTWFPKFSVLADDVLIRQLVARRSWTISTAEEVEAQWLVSPFETLQITRSEQFARALAKLRNDSSCSIASDLADRVQKLEQLSIEDYPEDPMLSVESAEKFFAFAGSIPGMSMPDIVLSPRANIVAEWHWSSMKHLSLEFLPTGIIAYVLFAPDPALKNHLSRNSGTASIDTLLRVLAPYNAHRWLRESLG